MNPKDLEFNTTYILTINGERICVRLTEVKITESNIQFNIPAQNYYTFESIHERTRRIELQEYEVFENIIDQKSYISDVDDLYE